MELGGEMALKTVEEGELVVVELGLKHVEAACVDRASKADGLFWVLSALLVGLFSM